MKAELLEEPDDFIVRLEGIGPATSPVAVAAAAYRCMLDHGIRPDTFDPSGREIQAQTAVCHFRPRRVRY